ncbi:GNAT family N-acetyltransferase [Bifidobacterium scaligerum]|uniref:GNAT family N-acetyltransferase n=1 Tax=Bifidobacterium scaligerum TaxID=2052656 RepID=A0A2M9HSB9_9BIFI|nr:GNAT family N-acetyltransferase [Bifidobacterium scaligerum]PJM79692.1 GNAT family N-acetyltransferase [Bifidobacterium scaligerum]
MSESVTIRPLHRDDYPTLIDLVRRAWYADFDERTGFIAAQADWENCLARTTNAYTAVKDGKPVALILGRIDAHDMRGIWNRHKRQYMHGLMRLLGMREGIRAVHEIVGILAIDHMLLSRAKRSGRDYAGEVVLFVLDPEARGYGLGKRMFRTMMNDFRKSGLRNFFLFTDTTCNVGFYEHAGLSQVESITISASKHHRESMSFYLYEGEVPEASNR